MTSGGVSAYGLQGVAVDTQDSLTSCLGLMVGLAKEFCYGYLILYVIGFEVGIDTIADHHSKGVGFFRVLLERTFY